MIGARSTLLIFPHSHLPWSFHLSVLVSLFVTVSLCPCYMLSVLSFSLSFSMPHLCFFLFSVYVSHVVVPMPVFLTGSLSPVACPCAFLIPLCGTAHPRFWGFVFFNFILHPVLPFLLVSSLLPLPLSASCHLSLVLPSHCQTGP